MGDDFTGAGLGLAVLGIVDLVRNLVYSQMSKESLRRLGFGPHPTFPRRDKAETLLILL